MLRTAQSYIMPAHLIAKTPVVVPADAPTFDTHELPDWANPKFQPVEVDEFEQAQLGAEFAN